MYPDARFLTYDARCWSRFSVVGGGLALHCGWILIPASSAVILGAGPRCTIPSKCTIIAILDLPVNGTRIACEASMIWRLSVYLYSIQTPSRAFATLLH